MTEQQVAHSSISLSPKKQEGQPHDQAQPSMPGDGIVPHGTWRIQLKKPKTILEVQVLCSHWRSSSLAQQGCNRSPMDLS